MTKTGTSGPSGGEEGGAWKDSVRAGHIADYLIRQANKESGKKQPESQKNNSKK